MWRHEEWARPEWSSKVNKALETVSIERDSSETLIETAESDLALLRDALDQTMRTLDGSFGETLSAAPLPRTR
jgi:hypothetical protein